MAVFFVTQYNSSLSSFVPNFRILSQVVAEKSLTEKKFTDRQTNRQTNIITEKAKTIYPLYTSYRGYNNLIYMNEKNDQIKGLISNMWLFFVTQYNLSLSSFVPNFRILSQVVAQKSLTEKKCLQTDKPTDRQT